MSPPEAHIAGIGISSSSSPELSNIAVSACTKALLDAGITYAKVDLSIACFLDHPQLRIPRTCFKAFGKQKAPVCEVDSHSALHMATQCIRSGQTDCAILVGLDAEPSSRRAGETPVAAVAIVLVSDRFLNAHAYLKDSAVCVRACHLGAADDTRKSVESALGHARLQAQDLQMVEIHGSAPSSDAGRQVLSGRQSEQQSKSTPGTLAPVEGYGVTGLAGLCGFVWRLRGWTHEPRSRLQNCLQYIARPSEGVAVVILCRSDGASAPGYEDVKNLRDGRERLGYNPAEEMREIDWRMEGVKSREGDRLPLNDAAEHRLAVTHGDRAALARL